MIPLREKPDNVKLLEQFIEGLNKLTEEDLIFYVEMFLNRKFDKKIAINELHGRFNHFNYLANNFYILFNDKYYYPSLSDGKQSEDEYFTLEEIAKKFNVSEKTITNWEKAGLKIKRPSPRVLIISKKDLFNFFENP